MKPTDLRSKTKEELNTELTALLKEQFNLRMQKGAGQPPSSQLLKNVRLNIARIKTILHEKGSSV